MCIQECFLTMNAKSVSWPFLVQNSYCLFYTFLWLRRWDRTHLYTCETTNGLRYFAVFLIRWTHPLLTLALYIYVFARHVRYFQKPFFNCIKPCCIFQYQLSMLECEWTMKTVDLWNIMKRIWQKTVQDKILKHFWNENNRNTTFTVKFYVLVYVVWRIHKIKYKLRSNYINAIYMYAYNILRYVYWSLYLEKILWKNHHLKWLTETNVLHMTTDPLYPRADTEETFTLKTLKVGICFQYRNEFIGYRIYTT